MSDPATIYQVARDGQIIGQFTEAEIRQRLGNWQLSMTDMAWTEGMTEWQVVTVLFPPPARPQAPLPPPPLPGYRVGGTVPAKRSSMSPWLIGLLVVVILAVAGTFVSGVVSGFKKAKARIEGAKASSLPILEERKGHTTQWKKSSYQAAGEADEPPPDIFQKITYTSPAGELAAYLTPDPKDGRKHPAILWAHGGFGGVGSYFWEPAPKKNDQSARAFREKGLVMMCPSWRGENANPGRFELFYGELDDYLAALEYVRKLPYVDPDRIYLGGHSTGGTMVLLASVASDKFRAAFSFGGMPDCVSLMANGGYGNTPYELASAKDNELRSPIRYTAFIKQPTFYFEGANSAYPAEARKMMGIAKPLGVPFQAYELPGDHFNILYPITNLVADKIAKDVGPKCNLTFTQGELEGAIKSVSQGGLADLLKKWMVAGDDLGKRLEAVEEEQMGIETEADFNATLKGIKQVTGQPVTELAIENLTHLALLGAALTDDDFKKPFTEKALPLLQGWGTDFINAPPAKPEVQEKFVGFLDALSYQTDAKSAVLIISAVKKQIAPESGAWESLFSNYTKDHERTKFVFRSLSANPPAGAIGQAVISAANQLFLDEWEGKHPYNSDAGAAVMEGWLHDESEENSPAFQVALALAFLDEPIRAKLLPQALSHKVREVQMEAAWADAKHKGAKGLALLKEACLNESESVRAQTYLTETDQAEQIPAAALEPKFAAKAKMTDWLKHPQELGEPPSAMEIYDQRELCWPPTKKKTTVSLLKFTYDSDGKPKVGYGMVGNMTWSSFLDYDSPPTPESLYLHHCTLELQRGKRTEKAASDEAARAAALKELRDQNPGQFTEAGLK